VDLLCGWNADIRNGNQSTFNYTTMTKSKQRNNHARSKRKRRALRLKNFFTRIVNNRLQKKQKAMKEKGTTFVLPNNQVGAKDFAPHVETLWPQGSGFLFDNHHPKNLNQRQKRKIKRQNPHLYKRA
jgi:hypothetical protein